MVAVHHQYTEEMKKKFGYLAAWLPNQSVRLGDVGILQDRVFEQMTTLDELGISFETRFSDMPADYEYQSSDKVSVQVKLSGELPVAESVLTKADAGIGYYFHDANAIVFQALKCNVESILEKAKLGEKIIQLFEKEQWPRDYVIITDLIRCKSATILISSGRDGYIEFAVNANVQANQFIKIADAETKLRLVQSSNIGTQIVGTKNLTPLFKVFGIKQGLFRKPKFIARGEQEVANEEMMAEIEFTELNYSDFE